jgi:hypothetical protein
VELRGRRRFAIDCRVECGSFEHGRSIQRVVGVGITVAERRCQSQVEVVWTRAKRSGLGGGFLRKERF